MSKNQLSKQKEESGFDTIADKIKQSVAKQIYSDPRCQMCQSQYRLECEKMYDEAESKGQQRGVYTKIEKFLQSKGVSIDYDCIRRHFHNHYNKQKQQVRIQSYIDGLADYRLEQESIQNSLLDKKTVLNNMMLDIASSNEGLSLEEKRKNADVIKKLLDSSLAIDNQLHELSKADDMMLYVINIIKNHATNKSQEIENEEFKNHLLNMVEDIMKELQELMYSGINKK